MSRSARGAISAIIIARDGVMRCDGVAGTDTTDTGNLAPDVYSHLVDSANLQQSPGACLIEMLRHCVYNSQIIF
jgi:hypothetical protein